MKLQSILSSAIMASIFLSGILDVEAMQRRPARTTVVNDLQRGSNEELLYQALVAEGVDIVTDPNLKPKDIKGLHKYMEKLLASGLTADSVRAYRGSRREKAQKLKNRIWAVIDIVAGEYHVDASEKAIAVRDVIHSATGCIGAIADAIIAANNPDPNIGLAAFNAAIGAIDVVLNGPLGLRAMVNDFNEEGVGATGEKLQKQKHEIRRLEEAIRNLVALWITALSGSAKMEVFHVAYCSLCARSMGADLLELCDEKDPATAANNNTTFTQRYTMWIRANKGGRMPVDGQAYDAD
ncbi:MAG: hypothetical protein LBQ08_02530 [Holosporaceae bacterium]|jgi:hypothetical protein|nr:hypothetical protein [Holosporaceae bacterium]